ncbi:MAG: cation diffusion facilitator family transporter [Planctomycetota bacterium]|nr:cation diffusion facilitator family transporter [Planctomycetota bacterium]
MASAEGLTRGKPVDRGAGAHRITLFANLLLAASKLGVGFLAGSAVLVADGWHSLSDVAMNLLAWGGYTFSRNPPDEDHHYGHGNFEAVASMVVGLIVLGAGLGVVGSVVLGDTLELESALWGGLALGVGVASGAVKLWLAIHTSRIGNELRSLSLVAVSRDNMADALVGILVPLAIGCSLLGLPWVENGTAVVIGLWIGWMGIASIREGLDVLMDRITDPGLRSRLSETAGSVAGVRGVQRVRVHPLGSSLRVDMEISVDGEESVSVGHRIAHAVENAVVAAHAHVVEVSVHVNPAQELPGAEHG